MKLVMVKYGIPVSREIRGHLPRLAFMDSCTASRMVFRFMFTFYAFMYIVVNAQIHKSLKYYAKMNTRPDVQQIIAKNIRALLDAKYNAIDTQTKLATKSGVAQTTISRILSCDVSTSIESMDGIATAFNLEPWQLFVINLDPHHLPILGTLSDKQIALYKKLVQTAKELGVETGSFAAVPDKRAE